MARDYSKDFEEYYRSEEAKNPMTKEEVARDKANREYEKRMLEKEAETLKQEKTPEFKAQVEKAIRGGSGRGGSARGALGSTGPKNLGGKPPEMRKGGKVKKYSIDGIAKRGKTRAR